MTDLRGAFLGRVHLEGALLREAHLERAFLGEMHLESANLSEAHLEGARALTQAQLDTACGEPPPMNLPVGLTWTAPRPCPET